MVEVDGVQIRPGGGSHPTVATDDVDDVHYQINKLDWGDDGESIPASGEFAGATVGEQRQIRRLLEQVLVQLIEMRHEREAVRTGGR